MAPLMRLAVIGAGSWGTTVAALGARNAEHVSLWARRPELAEAIHTSGENPDYLPGRPLGAVMATARLDEALDGADVVALAVPSHGFRSVLAAAAPFVPPEAVLLSLAKGLEQVLRQEPRPTLNHLPRIEATISQVVSFDGLKVPVNVYLPAGAPGQSAACYRSNELDAGRAA